jgi:hypothetical protein
MGSWDEGLGMKVLGKRREMGKGKRGKGEKEKRGKGEKGKHGKHGKMGKGNRRQYSRKEEK